MPILSLQIDAPVEWRQQLMRKVSYMLEPYTGNTMNRVPWARIPVLNFKEGQTGVDCDLCVCNREAVFKSLVLREMSRIDHRFPDLVRLVWPALQASAAAVLRCGDMCVTFWFDSRWQRGYAIDCA